MPQGITLTYPHVLTVEDVRGNENWPTARQNTILPFTRGLAGPTDYTMTYDDPHQKTTNAHQLALGVAVDATTVIREAMNANGGIALRIIPRTRADHGSPPRYEPSE